MHIDNETGFAAAFTGAMDSDGREHVVVVVKASFSFPQTSGAPCEVAEVQTPLLMADTFWGEPGYSAQREEMDFAHVKAKADILFDAVVHAPEGRPAERVRAGARVGNWAKSVEAVGNRVWLSGPSGARASGTRPFVSMPVSYGLAFGGVDSSDPKEDSPDAYAPNPAGRGWHKMSNLPHLTEQPLPNFEQPGEVVDTPWGTYQPAGLGPMARGWPQRLKYGGTYDQNWIDSVFPFLPADFDPRYYQAAPEDQQVPHLAGGEQVTLINLTPEGKTEFSLPRQEMPVLFSRRRAEDVSISAPLDTVMLRPEQRLMDLTWRASLPLSRDIFEVTECIVGPRSRAFWRARKLGKTYYPSLKALPRKEPAE